MRVLWIVQDGILAGPGAAQTVPYLRGLAAAGFRMGVLSVEKPRYLADRDRAARTRSALAAAGVRWTALSYGSGPAGPRPLFQARRVFATARGLVRRDGVDLVHARSYLPALVAAGTGRAFLFDMRGLWPRERVDGGVWREGSLVHRAASRLERFLLGRAAGVVVLATGALDFLPRLPVPVRVIPTAVDLDRFRPGLPPPAGAGALGTWSRTDDALDLLALAVRRSASASVLLLTEEDPRAAVRGLVMRGVPAERIVVRSAPPDEVPCWFSLGAAGILFVRSAPSKRASAPTKLGEFLACGVPVILTPGIGDSEEIAGEGGVVVREFSEEAYGAALDEIEARFRSREERILACRRAAREGLSLESAVASYSKLYRELGERTTCA